MSVFANGNAKTSKRRAIAFVIAVVIAGAAVYLLLPELADLNKVIDRLREGDPAWLFLALLFELCSFAGYVALFRTVFIDRESRISWSASYQITMAGVAATRFFAAAGAGGIALTYWAVRRSGMRRRLVVCRLITFLALLYGTFMITLLIDGLFLRIGLFPGNAPFEVTLIPAIFAGVLILIFLLTTLLPGDIERRLEKLAQGRRKMAKIASRLATGPALVAEGTRWAIQLIRDRRVGLLGAPVWWFFDILVLWACFKAFGDAPPQAVLIMGYFVGMLANLLPFFPGGVGAVDAGMVGAFTLFGVPVDAAVVAVLSYRAFAFWLPTVPGLIAYLQLRKTVKRWDADDNGTEPNGLAAGSLQ